MVCQVFSFSRVCLMLLPSPLLAHMVLLHAGALRMHAFAMITVVVMGYYSWGCCAEG